MQTGVLGEMRGLLFILTYLSISCNDYLGMHGKKKASDLPLQTCWSNSLLSDQQSPDTEIELLCSQLFAYPNESHLLSPQGRSSNESVLLPRPQRGVGVRMVNPGLLQGWDWHRVQSTGHWGSWSAGVSQPRLSVQTAVGTCPRNRAGLCLPPATAVSSLKDLL